MGRSKVSDDFSRNLTEQFARFRGSKEEFMRSIDGVTADIRVKTVVIEPFTTRVITPWRKPAAKREVAYYYCTVFQGEYIFEVFSFGDEKIWHAKH